MGDKTGQKHLLSVVDTLIYVTNASRARSFRQNPMIVMLMLHAMFGGRVVEAYFKGLLNV